MPHEVQGVVATAKGAPVTLETVVVPDPGPGEALVDVQTCGVCHTDLHYREGGMGTTTRTFLATKPPGPSLRWATASSISNSETSSSSTGGRCAAPAEHAAVGDRGTASTLQTRPNR